MYHVAVPKVGDPDFLELRGPRDAAWLNNTNGSPGSGSSAPAGAAATAAAAAATGKGLVVVSVPDFAAAAGAYWTRTLGSCSEQVAQLLQALERGLRPSYEAFCSAQQQKGLAVQRPGESAAMGAVDATQQRAQLLAGIVHAQEALLQVRIICMLHHDDAPSCPVCRPKRWA